MITVYHCGDCLAAVFANDDAGVCIECGGRNVRVVRNGWCCVRCGESIGYLGRLVERLVGDLHRCDVLRRVPQASGGEGGG